MLNLVELVTFIEESSKSTLSVPTIPPLPAISINQVMQHVTREFTDLFIGYVSNRLRGLMNRHSFSAYTVDLAANRTSTSDDRNFTLSIRITPSITRNILFCDLSFDSIYVRGSHYRNDRHNYLKLFGESAVLELEQWAYGI
jgi:hypothetical protein